jgi:ABC-type multidrug transport system ATPase subunit
MSDLRRWLSVLAILSLGIVSAHHLPIDYFPSRDSSDLDVLLLLSKSQSLELTTRTWVLPIEQLMRGLGKVRSISGLVRRDQARLSVSLDPGVDLPVKASRLAAELDRIKRRLPEGSRLFVHPAAGSDDLAAVIALRGAAVENRDSLIRSEIQSLPGIRSVRSYGQWSRETVIELDEALDTGPDLRGPVLTAAMRALVPQSLGIVLREGREASVVSAHHSETREVLSSVSVAIDGSAVELGSVSELRTRAAPPAVSVHFRGDPARLLLVRSERGVSPLALESQLRSVLQQQPAPLVADVLWSEGELLRALLWRLLLGLSLTSAVAALLGLLAGGARVGFLMGIVPATLLAASTSGCYLFGVTLDSGTFLALWLSLAAALPPSISVVMGSHSGRIWPAWPIIATALAVPILVTLAGRDLFPSLIPPAGSYVVGLGFALAASLVLPRAHVNVGARAALRGGERWAMRDPIAVFLLAASLVAVSAVLFSGALVPVDSPVAGISDLTMGVGVPPEATLAETRDRISEIERFLDTLPEVQFHWSVFSAGEGRVNARLGSSAQTPVGKQDLLLKLRYGIPNSSSLSLGFGGVSSSSLGDSVRDSRNPMADRDGRTYQLVVRATDLAVLRHAFALLSDRLAGLRVRSDWIHGPTRPATLLEARPVAGVDVDVAIDLARRLERITGPPRPEPIGGDSSRLLGVYRSGATEMSSPPQRARLLDQAVRTGTGGAVVPASVFLVTERVAYPSVQRQSGRFVIPLELRFPQAARGLRLSMIREIHRSLKQLPLPIGADLVQPKLDPFYLGPKRFRLLLLAATAALTFLGLAVFSTGSVGRAGLVSVGPLLGVAAALPVLHWSGEGHLTELSLLSLIAAVSGTLGVTVGLANRLGLAELPTGQFVYRRLRQETTWVLLSVVALAALLVAPTVGIDGRSASWVVPLRGAAAVWLVGVLSSLVLLPAGLAALAALKSRSLGVARRDGQGRSAFPSDQKPRLSVSRVVKTYPSGHRALRGVDFELQPGITGLLGPNGAGKTTLLRILTGLLTPSRGTISYKGSRITADNRMLFRSQIGYLPQEFNAYPGFSAREFLRYWAYEKGISHRRVDQEAADLLSLVGLAEHGDREVRALSGGMRRRIGIARALLGAPPVLIVDEPTTGLDVDARRGFQEALLEVASRRVVLFSTHLASDVELIANRLLILNEGRLIYDGTPSELLTRAEGRVFEITVPSSEIDQFSADFRLTSRVPTAEGVRVRALLRGKASPGTGTSVRPNLEEAYLVAIESDS